MSEYHIYIVGKPKKINSIEVAEFDYFEKYYWEDAQNACKDLGEGWRLPTKDELIMLYHHKDEIGNFEFSTYWSSSILPKSEYNVFTSMFILDFIWGKGDGGAHAVKYAIRAVRSC